MPCERIKSINHEGSLSRDPSWFFSNLLLRYSVSSAGAYDTLLIAFTL